MSDELVVWLRRMLDADEADALAATPGPWRYDPEKHWREPGTVRFEESVFAGPKGHDAISVALTGHSDDPQSMRDAAHIARHDPARVLRDIAAKRAIVASHTPSDWPTRSSATCPICATWDHDVAMGDQAAAPVADPCPTLRHLAAVYADRPGYQEGWRP